MSSDVMQRDHNHHHHHQHNKMSRSHTLDRKKVFLVLQFCNQSLKLLFQTDKTCKQSEPKRCAKHAASHNNSVNNVPQSVPKSPAPARPRDPPRVTPAQDQSPSGGVRTPVSRRPHHSAGCKKLSRSQSTSSSSTRPTSSPGQHCHGKC